ncbi:MAG: GNAT family N-acetyltransferase [Micromonosporaceae bacterium]
MPEFLVRPQRQDDIDALAEVHVRSWQAGYQGLMPADFLAAQDPAWRARQRRESWGRPDFAHVRGLVAEEVATGSVVGFANFGPGRAGDKRGWSAGDLATDSEGELYALYVHPDHWGRGAGGLLLDAALDGLRDAGLTPIRIWVLDGNTRALSAYRTRGFAPDGAKQLISLGQHDKIDLPEVRLSQLDA